MKDTTILYSRDDDDYRYMDENDLIDEMVSDSCGVGCEYYSAEFSKILASDLVNAERIIEEWDNTLYDLCGMEDAPFDDVGQGAKDELSELLIAWITKHVKLNHYEYNGNSKEHTITLEQLQERDYE